MSALHFYKVRWKNLLSSGDIWTEVQLDKNKSTLIVGENGAGKSTLLDAICFGLYGKPFRKINKPQLVNSINKKGTEVEVYFRTGGKDYIIKRGIKPGIFEIWRDEELLNQDAAAKDYQSYLEEHILKMNFKSFGQIVVLGSSTFVPFMQLPAGQRRDVIEDLLDIQIFTSMNSLLKERVSENKFEIQEIKYEIDLLKNKIYDAKNHNESIRKMKTQAVGRIKEKATENINLIESENRNIDELSSNVEELFKEISDKNEVSDFIEKCKKYESQLKTKLDHLKKDNQFFQNHDDCPTCRQDIDSKFKEKILIKNINTTTETHKNLNKIDVKLNDLEFRMNEIKEVEDEISKLNIKIQEHRANIKITKNTLETLKKELKEAKTEVEEIDTQNISDLQNQLKSYQIKEEQLIKQKEVLTVVGAMLKDGGIKTRIIRQYVPVMNKLINKYLASMDFFVDFRLDESFNETIKSRFRDDFSYASFSEGEKLRIDLSLLFTWRAVSKIRNSVSTNLLIMDEIMDSSLDNSGTEEFLKIINELTEDSNIFIISHKGDQLFDKFDHTIHFKKVKNFSIME